MSGWTPPLTWAAGNILTAAKINTYLKENLLALIRPVGILSFDEWPTTGSPASLSDILVQAGNETVNFSASFIGYIYFPTPFPNGLIAMVARTHPYYDLALVSWNVSLAAFKMHWLPANAGGTGDQVVQWIAIGY